MKRARSCASADLLWETRRAAKLTQRQLAQRAGTRQSSISRIEHGGVSPTVETLARLIGECGYELELNAHPREAV